MRRLARWTLNALILLSLLLCVAAATLWAWSSHRFADLEFDRRFHVGNTTVGDNASFVWSLSGFQVTLVRQSLTYKPPYEFLAAGLDRPARWHLATAGVPMSYGLPGPAGFYFKTIPRPDSRQTDLRVPFWAATLLTAVLPVIGVIRWRRAALRRRREREARCIACNYNLTGNTSGVCPECGTPTAGAPA